VIDHWQANMIPFVSPMNKLTPLSDIEQRSTNPTMKMAQPVARPNPTEVEWPLPNIPPIITNDPDPENYQEFLIRAQAEEARRTAIIDDRGRHSPSEQPAEIPVHVPVVPLPILPFKFTKKSQGFFYGLLVVTLLLLASTITALVFLIIDSRRFGAQPGHVIWFSLSVSSAFVAALLLKINRRLRADKKCEWEDDQAMELAATLRQQTQRTLHEARDREIQREALERAARRSLHSAQESERDVRLLTDRLSEMGVPNPIADTDDNPPTPTHWEDDPYPMTEEERNERRQARDELIAARRMKEAERPARKEADQPTTPPMGGDARRAEILANRERLNRSRENVGGWVDHQSTSGHGDPQNTTPAELAAEVPAGRTLVGSPPTSSGSRWAWRGFSPSRLLSGRRGESSSRRGESSSRL
jgi:hypothetical protein